MEGIKILNLYAGIGGNRKLWGDKHDITAVEIDPKIAQIYQDFFPNDKVIVADAHQYLLDHFEEFDFIWSSPPCPSHSRIRKSGTHPRRSGKIQNKPLYPDMKLYEEIIFLTHHAYKKKWAVENVISYYEPLVVPIRLGRHYFWGNFPLTNIKTEKTKIWQGTIKELSRRSGFDFNSKQINAKKKLTLLRNCVEPEIGKHILNCALNKTSLF